MEKKWTELTPDEKREKRFRRWLSPPGVSFSSPEAAKGYQQRVSRFIRVIKLETPDRVPVILPAGTFPLYHAGLTLKEAMYDNEKLCRAYRRFFQEFDGDTYASPGMVPAGKTMEIIGSLSSKWPGHGLPDNARMQQYVEGEYMKADEYDIFLDDLSDFCLRYYLPRTLAALAPFANFSPLPHILGMPNRFLAPAITPEVRAMYRAIIEYGSEMAKWQEPLAAFDREALAAGYPSLYGGQSHAPFDILADTLRGTKGIVMDMYRQPEKVLEAMEKLTPINVDCGLWMANASGRPIVFFALHKGDDTFMSDKQFAEFYWPYLRRLFLAMIDEGLVPMPFAEGKYNNRLKQIADTPKSGVVWYFDQTDMKEAKRILGDVCCIAGNVPTSVVMKGTVQQVKDTCRKLIEDCAAGGGYILAGGASIDNGKIENLKAMMDAAKEYGVYKK